MMLMQFIRLPLSLFTIAWQSAFLALAQIWANKMRSVLTTIGIVIGVASVTAVIAALSGLKKNVLTEFESFGTNKIFIVPEWPNRSSRRSAAFYRIRFQPELFDNLLDHCPSIKSVTRLCDLRKSITFGSKTEENVTITGIEPSWHQIENRSVIVGRPFTFIDNEQARAVCLVNPVLQNKLGLDRDPTGQSIVIGGQRFLVVGVIEARAESAMFSDGSSGAEAIVPFKTARIGQPFLFMYGMAASKSPDVSDEARAELTFFMRKRRGIRPGDQDNFRIEAIEKFVQQFKTVATGITMVAGGVVGISLLVGGVGIMNIMLVSVSERTREIGLRKAVGAKPSAILLQFLVEATMLCVIGGIVGIVIGQLFISAIGQIPAAQLKNAYIPGWAIALSFGFSAGVGLIFGMFPAIKAARLDPIEALRHE